MKYHLNNNRKNQLINENYIFLIIKKFKDNFILIKKFDKIIYDFFHLKNQK